MTESRERMMDKADDTKPCNVHDRCPDGYSCKECQELANRHITDEEDEE